MRNTATEDSVKKILEEGFVRVEKFDTEKGGIYVETTEDPRGWMLGDKTRKMYKIPNLYAKALMDLLELTDLQIRVVPKNDDGSEVTVFVCNPQDTARMLLSKNDDVGSSIEYARIEVRDLFAVPRVCSELTAKMGTHVCIESLMRGSWIRVRVFPGSNILEMINAEESNMLESLESERIENQKVLADLVSRYVDIENEINALLPKMGRYGMSCTCDDPTVFKQIFQGKFDEITEVCLQCGGTIER